jgi:Zn-finger nucleic acid-binding protein
MRCPACSNTLEEHAFGPFEVDICRNGCRGIWFDRFELREVDEAHEKLGQLLLDAAEGEDSAVAPHDRRYKCPRCEMIMMRHQFRPDIRVQVDTCPKCAGVWLDHGELHAIRDAEGTDVERQAAALKYIEGMFEQIRDG